MHCIVWLIGLFLASAVVSENCSDEMLNAETVMSEINLSISEEDIRYVSSDNGADTGNCSDDEMPCKTLLYASTIDGPKFSNSSLKIKIYPGEYELSNHSIHFYESKNIVIEGSGTNNTIIRCGNAPLPTTTCFFENFAFFNSTNIWIRNITFDGCGPYPSAHYFFNSTNIILENNVYQRNSATAVIFYLSSPVYILSSHFKDNAVSNVSNEFCLTAFNGLFYRDNVTSTGGISIFNENYTQNVLVVDSHFDNNIARNNSKDDDNLIPSQLKRFGHGGGLSVRLVNSNNGSVCVMNSTFTNNIAEVEGGAITITIADSNCNNITLSDLTLNRNRCFIDKCTGGAVNIDLFAPAQQNKIIIVGCEFSYNSAAPGSGGAVSIAASDKGFSEGGSDAYALVTIDSCNFKYNKAKFEGTAVGLFFLGRVNQAGFRILMKDCLFEDNLSDSKDISALTTYRVLVEIMGYNNKYIGNVGGGVTLLNSRFDVRGRIEFHQNLAVFGGGLALSGRCLILLYENSSMLFEGNRATGSGAAIFVVYPSSNFVLPILNRGCFIQYFDENTAVDLPPQNWKTKIEFVNNSAESGGSAIFTNDLGRCQWLNLTNMSSNAYIFNPPDNVTVPFDMTRNLPNIDNATNATLLNLGTDPSSFTATPSKFDDASFGETIEVSLSTKDDVGNFRQTVWALNSDVTSFNSIRSLSRNKSPLALKIPDVKSIQEEGINATQEKGANITFNFMLLNGQGDGDQVTVTVKGSCNPGYKFNKKQESCVCDISKRDVVRCDENGRYIYIREGKWGFGKNDSNELIAEFTLPVFLKCAGESENGLPGCLFKYDFPDDQCRKGRQGDLCSQCRTKEGYAISLDIQRCVKDDTCGVVGVMIFIIICLCFVAFSLAALYYDFTLPNELRGFIFYAQVIGLIYRNSPYVTQSSTAINILVNLLGFSLPIPTCFTKDISALYVALLGLVPPFLVTLVTIIYVLSARFVCVKKLSNRKSIHGMVLLSLFVYKYVADTAFILISCRNLSHKHTEDHHTHGLGFVFQYDTNQICTEPPMVIFYVLALLTVLLFVIPIPILILITSKRHFSIWILKKLSLFRDALNIGVKKELYWFTAWDIFRRIPFVLTAFLAIFTPSSLIILIDCLIILFIITVHCVSKPYEKEYINVIEAVILGILFLSTVTILDGNDIYVGDFTSSVLLVIPFLYALIYLSIWPSLWIWNKYLKKYYRKLQRNVKSRFGKSFSVNATEGVTREFVMVGVEDASENEDDMQKGSTLNYLREPLLDDID